MKRDDSIDVVKALAAFMVVILHVNGFTRNYFHTENQINYIIMEILAFPAIHLFVMSSSKLIISNHGVKLKNLINIWLWTFFLTITGLLIILMIEPPTITLKGIFSCLFPVTGSAYWYISTFFAFVFVSPLLRSTLQSVKEYLALVIFVLLIITSILPSFFNQFDWSVDRGNLMLFVTLFYLTVYIENINVSKWKYILLYIISFVLCIISFFVLQVLNYNSFYLITYNSPFVVGMAAGLYGMLHNISIPNSAIQKIIRKISEASLVIYIVHMHPIIKTLYVDKGIFAFMHCSNSMIFVIEKILMCIAVVFLGECIYLVLGKRIRSLSTLIRENFHIKLMEKIDGWLNA